MDFTSPGSDTSVLARDTTESQEISLSISDDPVPILASTAHKRTIPGDNIEMINRIQHLAEMAGSYLDSKSGSDAQESDNQFHDLLKANLSHNSSSSSQCASLKISLDQAHQTTSEESSLSMLDMDHIAVGGNLVQVESNVSLGSWLGDVMPERCDNTLQDTGSYTPAKNQGAHPEQADIHNRNGLNGGTPRLNSRYFMNDSQLGSFSGTPQGTSTSSFIPPCIEEENSSLVNASHSKDKELQGRASSIENLTCDPDPYFPSEVQGGKFSMPTDCFGDDLGELLDLQQAAFGNEEFTENIADILDQDEEKFEEEHKLMMNSRIQEDGSCSGTGLSPTEDSPTKMEYFDSKLSIGTYMAARSEKLGMLGPLEISEERPSFGWKIKSPPRRHAESSRMSLKSNETCSSEMGQHSNSSQNDTLTRESESDGTLEAQPQEVSKVDNNEKNYDLQELVLDQDSLSLSAAMMNMSTSVSNEDLARAIIEITKKKEQRLTEKKMKPLQHGSSSQRNSASSSQYRAKESDDKPARKSRIPIGVKSPSPPQPMPIKKNSLNRDIKPTSVSKVTGQCRSSSSIAEGNCEVNVIYTADAVAPSITPPSESSHDSNDQDLRSVGSGAMANESAQKEEKGVDDAQSTVDQSLHARDSDRFVSNVLSNSPTSSLKSGSTAIETEKYWNHILQESFMHDNPEKDDTPGKSSPEQEAMSFHEARVSTPFSGEVSNDFLLSSTRTESSLLRGSLSRESIEELHKKLRVQSSVNFTKPVSSNRGTASVERTSKRGVTPIVKDDIVSSPDLKKDESSERTSLKMKHVANQDSIGPLSHSSPEFNADSRYSGEFHEMRPSMTMTMSFGEMATIHEHQFNLHDIDEKNGDSDNGPVERCNRILPKTQKLDAITEEAETTQDTILSTQSSGSGESQIPSELCHPAQHSTTIAPVTHMQSMPPQNVYMQYQHPHFPRMTGTMATASLPNLYKSDLLYPRSLDGPHHSIPLDYHSHRNAGFFPHPFGRFPLPNTFTQHSAVQHPAAHFSFDQASVASSSEMALNHTANSLYPQSAFLQHGVHSAPRPPCIDSRCPQYSDMYYHPRPFQPFEGLSVSSELIFPQVCCVSLTSTTNLLLENKSDRWLQADVTILTPTIECCFLVEAKPVVGPREIKNIEVAFSPQKEGKFEGIMEVASYPVSPSGVCPPSVRPVTTLVNLKANAENPKVELMGPNNKKILDFGEIVNDGSKYLPLKIHNKGSSDVPVCIILCTKSQDRRCFAVSDSSTVDWQDQEKRNQSIHRATIHPGSDSMTVWVHCKIPAKYSNANEPPTSLSAQVFMELDSTHKQSFDSVVLDTITVDVIVCVAKLQAPKNMQPLNFICAKDSSETVLMPVKNCGNVSSNVTFDLLNYVNCFEISPQRVLLAPGEQVEVTIMVKPTKSAPNKFESTFLMKIEPNGTKYEITINVTCTDPLQEHGFQRQSFADSHSPLLSNMPSLLTNKSHLCWGGVAVGQSLQQRVVLRTSNGSKRNLPMRLMIKGLDAACFQILRDDDRNREELCSRQEIVMQPGHDKVVKILYGPTKSKMTLAKLEIKAPVDQVPSTKFTIPLSGYGGRCDLKVDDLDILPKEDGKPYISYIAYALSSDDDQKLTVKFTVKNNSSRHAFVKTVLYSDRECLTCHSLSNAPSPSQFILPKQSSRVVRVSLNKQHLQRTGYTRDGKELIGTLCLWHGEEIARHLLKNALGKFGPSAVTKFLSESNPLRSIAFDGIFEGEGSCSAEEDLEQVKPQFGDIQVFYSSIKKSVVEIFGPRPRKPFLEMVEPGKTRSTLDKSKLTTSHLHYKRTSKVERTCNVWEISPEFVTLPVPSLSDNIGPSKIKIINDSKTPLKFDAAWSRNYLTITPHCGQVDPESVSIILLNANPSLATRRDELPWIGNVQISTQSGRDMKLLRVQIRDDIEALDSLVHPASPSPHHPLKARYSEPLTLESFSTPMVTTGTSRVSEPLRSLPHTNKIMLPSNVLEFGSVPVKSSSKSHLEFTNVCPSTIRWILTSFAPAYVKSLESKGDLYRTTYAAFIFSHTSGLLETGVKVKIPVTFSPVSEGQYSQFWDLEHHEAADSAAISLNKVRIEVTGKGVPSTKGPQLVAQHTKPKDMNVIYVSEGQARFPSTAVNDSAVIKITVKNRSKKSYNAKFINLRPPFHMIHQKHTIRPMSYVCLPVTFKPTSKGDFEGTLVIQAEGVDNISVMVSGRGI